jgi:2',3'-cyclic-nucleotide 2'-phosphodiesterase (5'-nucleotidase family)
MKTFKLLFSVLFVATLFSCHTPKAAGGKDDGAIEITILQLNDVYEISPAASDNTGGMARVAGLQRALKAKNPNTITVLSGDFLNPSVTGTLKFEGKRIRGRQMVETMNAVGIDYVVFGNHEFDFDDLADLQARLDESNFTWMGANVRLKGADGSLQPFFKNKNGQKEICPDNKVLTFKGADGTLMRLGLFGVLINTGKKPYVEYTDWKETALKNYADLKTKSDVVVAMTHLAIADDKLFAAALPDIPLVMGGHDHENMFVKIGNTAITKADANAKSAYVHTLRYDKQTKKATVTSKLVKINGDLPDEPSTAAIVAKWEKIKNDALSSSGFDSNKKVTELKTPLDCREAFIRNQQAPVGKLITDAIISVCKTKPDCALINSGSVRVDDILSGTLAEIDIVRMLPFGGAVVECDMTGMLLRKTLETSVKNKGTGGYLQLGLIARDDMQKNWLISNTPLDDKKVYHVVLPDFLLTGNEQNMSFLKAALTADGKGTTNTDIPAIQKPNPADKTDLRNDIRLVVIKFLRG